MPQGASRDEWRAEEAICARFPLEWNAATSRWGAFADVVNAFAVAAAMGLLLVLAAHFKQTILAWIFGVLTAAPVVTCVAMNIVLLGARKETVNWLSALPFPIDNLNAVFAGFGEEFEVHFRSEVPARDVVMEQFAKVSEDVFVLATHEDQRMTRARLGVIMSKHTPQRQVYYRYRRFRQVVDRSLVALHEKHPIDRVLLI